MPSAGLLDMWLQDAGVLAGRWFFPPCPAVLSPRGFAGAI